MSHKVLIVDDDEEMCTELREILADEGYQVRVALDGRIGKEVLEKEDYHVVILDLKLPGLNGYEVLKSARENACKARIIVLSGRPLGSPLEDRNDALKAQENRILELADHVMSKPVPVPVLLDKVRSYSDSFRK